MTPGFLLFLIVLGAAMAFAFGANVVATILLSAAIFMFVVWAVIAILAVCFLFWLIRKLMYG